MHGESNDRRVWDATITEGYRSQSDPGMLAACIIAHRIERRRLRRLPLPLAAITFTVSKVQIPVPTPARIAGRTVNAAKLYLEGQ